MVPSAEWYKTPDVLVYMYPLHDAYDPNPTRMPLPPVHTTTSGNDMLHTFRIATILACLPAPHDSRVNLSQSKKVGLACVDDQCQTDGFGANALKHRPCVRKLARAQGVRMLCSGAGRHRSG